MVRCDVMKVVVRREKTRVNIHGDTNRNEEPPRLEQDEITHREPHTTI